MKAFLIILFLVVIVIAYFIWYLNKNRCPKCKANFFYYNTTEKKDLGYDPRYEFVRIHQQTYKCLKCKHIWKEITKHDERNY